MEAEGDHVKIGGSGKGDLGGGREVVGGGIELGVNDVAGDVERGTGDLRGGGECGGRGEGGGEEGRGESGSAVAERLKQANDAAGRGVQIFQGSIHSFAHCAAAGQFLVTAGWG